MRLRIFSDLHIEFFPFDPPRVNADVVILAGDIHVKDKGLLWALEKFRDIPVIYVLGNHEYYGEALPKQLLKLKQQASGTNIHILENESLEIDNVIFLCCTLWTDFNLFGDSKTAGYEATQYMSDYKRIRVSPMFRKLNVADTASIHRKSVAWLQKKSKQDRGKKHVVVTHHAPSIKSVPEHFKEDIISAAYASNLDHIVTNSKAELWVHGHMHSQFDYKIGDTRVICNPRGYYPMEPNQNFIPDLIVDV